MSRSSYAMKALVLLAAAAAIFSGAQAVLATTYEVGDGKPYTSIGAVPWESLNAGDTVLIYYRSTPYREKFVIGRVGTLSQPITVRGVAGAGGQLPILDGQNATTRLALATGSEARGIITCQHWTTTPPTCWPAYWVIENLEFRNASVPYTFTDDDGVTQSYTNSSAAIWLAAGSHITVRNCYVHDCGNGLFSYTADSGADNWSDNVLIEGCYVTNCGNAGSNYEHTSYTESCGITFQYNHYGPPRGGDTGSIGNNLKDRSAGTVIRYNWIEGGNRTLDLVDSEDSQALADDPLYEKTFIYGNVLLERNDAGNRQVVHFGHDAYMFPRPKGYFYNNTVVSWRAAYTTLVMQNGGASSTFDCRNNIIYVTTTGSNLEISNDSDGVVNLRNCWMKTGWRASGSGGGTVNDYGGNVIGSTPGFVDESGQDYHLAVGSGCINAGTTLHADCSSYPVNQQYVKHQGHETRPTSGALDIGAFEYSGGVADLVITTTSLPGGTVGQAYNQTVVATGGVTPYSWSISSGTLPAGLSINSSSGVISGTPTTAQTSNFTVRVQDSQGTPDVDTQALSITISPSIADLVITTTSLPGGTVGVAYSQTVVATGGVTPYSWSISSGSLPAGLSISSSSGVISGTPTTAQTSNFTVRVQDSQGTPDSDTQALSITISSGIQDLVITTTSLSSGTVGVAYSQTVSATGGVTPYSWSISSGTLPAGLSIGASTGIISGTPTTAQTSNFTVRVQDSQGTPDVDTQALSITINPAGGGGTTYYQNTSDGTSTTTSATYQNKLTLTFTPTASDDYIIIAYAEHSITGYGSHAARFTLDGAVEGEETRRTRGSDYFPFYAVKYATLGASLHTLAIDFAANGTDTASIRNARIVAMRKSALDVSQTAVDSQQTITTTMTDFATLTFTPPSAGDYLLMWGAEVHSVYAVNCTVQSALDGATVHEGLVNDKGNDQDAAPLATFVCQNLTAAQHTLKIRAQTPSGTGLWIRRCRLIAVRLTGGRFADYAYAASDTQSTTTSTTYVEKLSKTWTSGSTGNWLALMSASTGQSSTYQAVGTRLQYNDSTTLGENYQVLMDATEYLPASGVGIINVTGGSRKADVDYRSSSGSFSAEIKQVHLALLPLDSAVADLVITTTSLPGGTVGAAYSQTLAATGGVTPYTWSVISGSLPAGLTLGSSTGTISGTPTTANTYNFTVRVTDSQGTPDTDDQALSIVVSGGSEPTYRFTAADSETSTTSTSWQTKATLTFTPAVADDWVIFAFAEMKESSASYSALAQLVVDGVAEGEQTFRSKDVSDYLAFSSVKFKNLSVASHTISLQYRSASTSGTVYIRNARIVAIRKAAIAMYQTASDSAVALTTTMTDRATLNFTPAAANDYLFIYYAELSSNTGYSTLIQCLYDGINYDDGTIEAVYNNDYMTFMSFLMETPSAAAHTVKIQAAKETGSTATHNIRRARVIAIQLSGGRFDGYWGQSSDSTSTTTSTSWVEKRSCTWTTGNNGNWLLLNSARIGGTSTSYSTEARVQVNDTTTCGQQLREPKDPTDYMNFNVIDVRNLGSTRDADTDFRTENAAATAGIRKCRMYQLPLD